MKNIQIRENTDQKKLHIQTFFTQEIYEQLPLYSVHQWEMTDDTKSRILHSDNFTLTRALVIIT